MISIKVEKINPAAIIKDIEEFRGYRIMELPQLSKLMTGVRFPLPAPQGNRTPERIFSAEKICEAVPRPRASGGE